MRDKFWAIAFFLICSLVCQTWDLARAQDAQERTVKPGEKGTFNFGHMDVGQQKDLLVKIANSHDRPLVISQLTIVGPDSKDFVFDKEHSECHIGLMIPAKGFCSAHILFTQRKKNHAEEKVEFRFTLDEVKNTASIAQQGIEEKP
jgi:hypothetical protein